MATLVERAHELRPLIEEQAAAAEQERRLAVPVVGALTDAGLMSMCTPAAYGGAETDPVTLIEAIEAVAIGDGAAGWCSMIASTTSSMAAFLPAETAQTIYGDPQIVTGGVFAPNGVGAAIERNGVTGFAVTGQWAWGSGAQHCQWVLGGARCDDGTFRLCWFPQDDVDFHDTWHTGGMRGSGSLDYSVSDAFAPASYTMQPGVTPPVVDTPLSRFPNFTLLAAGVSAVGLGVGRHALDELNDLAQGKRPQYSSRTLAQNSFTQIELARAEAKLRSARAFLLDELDGAWATIAEGAAVTIEQRTSIRLAATHAATVGATVADAAFTLAGGTAVYDTSVLGRCLRDAHVVTQHIQTAPKLNEKIGQLLLGQDTDISMF
ncbi:MAG: acyl-CoA dehydrogenase family protein [Ilumatobacter sp.]|uniref:acyl-CoA dehydrogenase family protein n=2 Tax=Ilumatobacter sp. TaxID=1967498 RepID=UPI002A2A4932|nr:acyl-CoA dehydrogenase family protein [Ilumatobacter sp.]MDG1785935.1 acyl-CoA dehydrogenase family protein [Ilumatobacter sp.]MDG2233440.1 acyl-CoA dehydrogenase family protein [Ilumatobacter sp.]